MVRKSAGEMTGNEMITYLSRVRGARDAILSAVHEEGNEDRGV